MNPKTPHSQRTKIVSDTGETQGEHKWAEAYSVDATNTKRSLNSITGETIRKGFGFIICTKSDGRCTA